MLHRRLPLIVIALAGCASAGGARPAASSEPALCTARIARLWHGKVSNAKADEYDAYLAGAIKKFRELKGNVGYQKMRETIGEETHFSVISYWDTRESIKAYAGDDIRRVRDAPRDPEFLIDREPTVMNYDVSFTGLGCP